MSQLEIEKQFRVQYEYFLEGLKICVERWSKEREHAKWSLNKAELLRKEVEYCRDGSIGDRNWLGSIAKYDYSRPLYLTQQCRNMLHDAGLFLDSGFDSNSLSRKDVDELSEACSREFGYSTVESMFLGDEVRPPLFLVGESVLDRLRAGDCSKHIPGGWWYWFRFVVVDCQIDVIGLLLLEVVGSDDVGECTKWISTCERYFETVMSLRADENTFDQVYKYVKCRPPSSDKVRACAGTTLWFAEPKDIFDKYSKIVALVKGDVSKLLSEFSLFKDVADVASQCMPFVERNSRCFHTLASRSTMTTERIFWLIQYCISRPPAGDDRGQSLFDAFFADTYEYCYAMGPNGFKKVRSALSAFLDETVVDCWVAHNLPPLSLTVAQTTFSDRWYCQGVPMDLEHTGDRDGRGDVEVLKSLVSRRTWGFESSATLEILPRVSGLLSGAIRLSASEKHVLYEPVTVFGYTYSSHCRAMIAVLTRYECLRPILEKQGIRWAGLPSFISKTSSSATYTQMLACVNGLLNSAVTHFSSSESRRSSLEYTIKKLNTSKSSGGYSTKVTLSVEAQRRLGYYRPRKPVTARSNSKALTQVAMLDKMLNPANLLYNGSQKFPLTAGSRDVPGGRQTRVMNMVHTGGQILLTPLLIAFEEFFKHGGRNVPSLAFSFDPDCISPSRHDKTDVKKLGGIVLESSRAISTALTSSNPLNATSVFVSSDYATMDQRMKVVCDAFTKIMSPSVYDNLSLMRRSGAQFESVTFARDVNVGQLIQQGFRTAMFAKFGSKRGTHGGDGFLNCNIKMFTGGGYASVNVNRRTVQFAQMGALPGPVVETDYNTSGNILTTVLNNLANILILSDSCWVWGDDGVKAHSPISVASSFAEDAKRAADLGQVLDGDGSKVSVCPTYLKNEIYGLNIVQRFRTFQSEREASLTPLDVQSLLTSVYESKVRSGSDGGYLELARAIISRAEFTGYGFKSKLPPGWIVSGGSMPGLCGLAPITGCSQTKSSNPGVLYIVMKAFHGEVPRSIKIIDLDFTDKAGSDVLAELLGVKAGSPASVQFSSRLHNGMNEKPLQFSAGEIATTASRNYSMTEEPAKYMAEVSVSSMVSKNIKSAYSNRFRRQVVEVLHTLVSQNSTPRKLATLIADAVESERGDEIPVEPALPNSWQEVYGNIAVKVEKIGVFSFEDSEFATQLNIRVSRSRSESVEYPKLFNIAIGTLESVMLAAFGFDSERDDSVVPLPFRDRPDLQLEEQLSVIHELGLSASAAFVGSRGVSEDYYMYDVGTIRSMERLSSCGGFRMTGLSANVGLFRADKTGYFFKHMHIEPDVSSLYVKNPKMIGLFTEHFMSVHATIWNAFLLELRVADKDRRFLRGELPYFKVTYSLNTPS